MEPILGVKKNLGTQGLNLDSLPYSVVGGAWDGSMNAPNALYTPLNHIVPAGKQLKILFLKVWTQEQGGAVYRINQSNPATPGLTGVVEAYPVVGSVPPFFAGLSAVRDYPMLEAPGSETLQGDLVGPVHVLEGSIDFSVLNTPTPATGARYGIVWWGVEKEEIF